MNLFIYSENKVQKKDSLCVSSYVLYIIYMVIVIEIDLKSSVLKLYHQLNS